MRCILATIRELKWDFRLKLPNRSNIHPTRTRGQSRSRAFTAFGTGGPPHCPHGSILLPAEALSAENCACRGPLLTHLSALGRVAYPACPVRGPGYPAGKRSLCDPPQDGLGYPPCQMSLGQHQPAVSCMLQQSAPGFHQPLGQGPTIDSPRHHQPPPQVSQVVSSRGQPEPHLVGPEPMAARRVIFTACVPCLIPAQPRRACRGALSWIGARARSRTCTSTCASLYQPAVLDSSSRGQFGRYRRSSTHALEKCTQVQRSGRCVS